MKLASFLFIVIVIPLQLLSQYVEPIPVIGKKALKEMIRLHFIYPTYDFKEGTEGNVTIVFNTNIKGEVKDYDIVKSVSNKIDSCAIAIFRIILWEPATFNQKKIDGDGEFTLEFNINKFKRLLKKRGYTEIKLPHPLIDTSYFIYDVRNVDIAPKPLFEGNNITLNSYIYSNLVYPEAALKMGIEGEVEINFIIEKNGIPSNVRAVKYVGGGCSEEAIRLINSINWYPAIKDNKAVRASFAVKINFKKPENHENYIPNQQGSGI